MDTPGRYFKIIRFFARFICRITYAQPLPREDMPCVLLCRHRNMRGPIGTIIAYGDDCSPWIYYPFCDNREFAHQMYSYTLTKRLHWPGWVAKPASILFGAVCAPLIRSLLPVPVYRHDGRIRETFRKSVEMLENGRGIMIYPDIDYTSMSEDVGSIYDGFFMLERMYHKKTGRHLPFIPVLMDVNAHSFTFGEKVVFGDGPFNQEKEMAMEKLLSQWHEHLNGQQAKG